MYLKHSPRQPARPSAKVVIRAAENPYCQNNELRALPRPQHDMRLLRNNLFKLNIFHIEKVFSSNTQHPARHDATARPRLQSKPPPP
ncbi:hypothetical protein [Chromobacterium paludis]|uniref:Uncharacterized protein n=1 Tax=Chromobacterium paludis TaxID=2605945 RepID=A0A5C1DGC3_9NEIS|nr:hypothetical protein [Chromobacterium paludis]QEL55593.1 hypothetical protein FYK34_08430 [Chromobacterium paludis]